MDKPKVVNAYNGIQPHGGGKKWMKYYTCNNMDEPQQHSADCKKPGTEEHVSYDSIYIKYPQKVNL